MAVVRLGNGKENGEKAGKTTGQVTGKSIVVGVQPRNLLQAFWPAMFLTHTSAMRITQKGHKTCQLEKGSQSCPVL